jgi:nucleoside-diphosphate-sugar epimerase
MSYMKKRYLVTGGTGFIGRSLVEALVRKGHNVSVLDNESRGSFEKFGKVADEITFIKGDIRDEETVKKACKKIDAVVHLAFINGTENFYNKPDLVLDVGVRGMLNVIDGSIANHVEELFLASSSEVYNNPPIIPTPENVPLIIPDPLNPRYSYSGGKMISELLVLNNSKHFKKTVIFRPHNVYGPAMGYEHVIPQFIMKIKELSEDATFPIQGDGRQSRAFIYIDDFTAGLMKILQHGEDREIYHIGTPDEISIKDLAFTIAKLFDIKITIVPGELTHGSPQRRCPDITKLKKLGFTPKISLEKGLAQTIPWYKEH